MRPIQSFASVLLAVALTTACAQAPQAPAAASAPPQASLSDKDIIDAYHYMLGRWLVLRQESQELRNGLAWNKFVHRPPGAGTGANPILDVATSDGWMYIDETSCTMIDLPSITGRYYTVEILNGWGEVMDNVNERRNPKHPFGKFAMCLHGAQMGFPPDVRRLDLVNRMSRVLFRIELGAKPAEAIALQKQVTMKATGSPKIPKAVVELDFTDDKLPGVEGLDRTEAILAAEPDLGEGMQSDPGMLAVQAKARAVAKAAADPKQRARIDEVIRKQAIPAFLAAVAKGGVEMSGWTRPRFTGNYHDDFLARAVVNFTAVWANNQRECGSFTARDLDGSATYVQIFANTALPRTRAGYAWSVTAVDSAKMQVIANPLNRHLLGKQSELEYNPDGSLTLAFAPKLPAGIPQSNWLPTAAGKQFNLNYRFFGASRDIVGGQWAPPPLAKQ